MDILDTSLPEVKRLRPQPHGDARGWFARFTCETTLEAAGLQAHWPQTNLSYNSRRGVLRGLHYQAEPRSEIKLVTCLRGAIYDVVVDIRRDSPDYGRWTAVELRADTLEMLYVPAGFAHGFQTLTDDVLLHYHMSTAYDPDLARGVRHDDPALAIPWPVDPPNLSERDQTLPPLAEALP